MKKSLILVLVLGMSFIASQAWSKTSSSADRVVDIMKLTCKQAMSGDDMDRAATAAFFHGYLTAKNHSTVIDLDAASAQSNRVKEYCLSNPDSTVMEAFTKTANGKPSHAGG